MRQRWIAWAALATVAVSSAVEATELVDRWVNLEADSRAFNKILVVGITDDREARRNFENKFVSHLRGRGFDGITSHSLVPDLTRIDNQDEIIGAIDRESIDGAISVRVVPLGSRGESDWGTDWRQALDQDGRLRRLIEVSLPVTEQTARRYGVEVALWDARDGRRVWAGRTGGYSRKKLRKSAGSFVQAVMTALKQDKLL